MKFSTNVQILARILWVLNCPTVLRVFYLLCRAILFSMRPGKVERLCAAGAANNARFLHECTKPCLVRLFLSGARSADRCRNFQVPESRMTSHWPSWKTYLDPEQWAWCTNFYISIYTSVKENLWYDTWQPKGGGVAVLNNQGAQLQPIGKVTLLGKLLVSSMSHVRVHSHCSLNLKLSSGFLLSPQNSVRSCNMIR